MTRYKKRLMRDCDFCKWPIRKMTKKCPMCGAYQLNHIGNPSIIRAIIKSIPSQELISRELEKISIDMEEIKSNLNLVIGIMERAFSSPRRDAQIVEMILSGDTLQLVADKLGITRERVRQIFEKKSKTTVSNVRDAKRIIDKNKKGNKNIPHILK